MPGIFISLAISFLLFLYAPVDLYCANVSEFWFDFSTLLITALGMFAACFAVLMVLYLIAMLIHQYVYRIALAGGLTLFFCTYIQGNFMIDKLPPLDGTTIKWENYTILRTEDLILWSVALLIVVLMYVFLKKDLFSRTVMYLSGGLTLMLLITAVSVVFTSGALQERARYQLGGDNEVVMSDEQNFIILVLDTVDSRTFAELLETHPEYAAEFQDFTYFENPVVPADRRHRQQPGAVDVPDIDRQVQLDAHDGLHPALSAHQRLGAADDVRHGGHQCRDPDAGYTAAHSRLRFAQYRMGLHSPRPAGPELPGCQHDPRHPHPDPARHRPHSPCLYLCLPFPDPFPAAQLHPGRRRTAVLGNGRKPLHDQRQPAVRAERLHRRL